MVSLNDWPLSRLDIDSRVTAADCEARNAHQVLLLLVFLADESSVLTSEAVVFGVGVVGAWINSLTACLVSLTVAEVESRVRSFSVDDWCTAAASDWLVDLLVVHVTETKSSLCAPNP